MPVVRWASALVVVGLAALFPAPAAAKLEFNLPAQIFKVFDESLKSRTDPNRCQAIVFVEFPKIRNAKGYRIVVERTDLGGQRTEYLAPPFETDGRGFSAKYPAPNGFGRFFLGAYSSPHGCGDADARTEYAKVVEAKVSLSAKFERKFDELEEPPFRCAPRSGERTYRLGPPAKLFVVVRRQGTVTTYEKGSTQPLNLATNRYAAPGTTIKTGRDSVVSVSTLDGTSVLVAPGTTVRLTTTGLEVLEPPKSTSFKLKAPEGPYKVRTCSGVISARG